MNIKRARVLKKCIEKKGSVIYWMSREQRVTDNWALLYTQELALKKNERLIVVFNIVSEFGIAALRQYAFMIRGLKEVEQKLVEFNIPFYLLIGKPEEEIPGIINKTKAGLLITDFDPLKIKREWKKLIAEKIDITMYEVDARNIVPAFFVSGKEEFSARTLRIKINKVLIDFLEEYPPLKKMPSGNLTGKYKNNWQEIYSKLKIDFSVPEVEWIKPGEGEALKMLEDFLSRKMISYNDFRNDPVKNSQSNLSPYLHFGQISAQRVVLEIEKFNIPVRVKEAFLEQLVVRRELSDNFCLYNNDYDSFEGFPKWAQNTLNEHKKDKREYIYSLEEFETAGTHEELWNAAQMELLVTGKMHGYMRMYWAKKILEWTKSPEEALRIVIYLNDKYSLDGRDPNGYVGCAWSIGGVHDRPWKERPVFGKIRYMNKNGCERKFDVNAYIKKFTN